MIALFVMALTTAVPSWDDHPGDEFTCATMAEPMATRCGLAVQQLICWTTESHNIRDDDPALLFFLNRRGDLADAKSALAYERQNGCDQPASDEFLCDDDPGSDPVRCGLEQKR